MLERVLKRVREGIRRQQYVMTLHAEEEMNDDNLTIYDVERAILTGKILERQRDRPSGEWKYRLRGRTMEDAAIEVIAKLGPTGKVVLSTVYRL